jgi:catechol 2,3-dioxygenase-like lactoylglutathione lyase family enzyme
MPAALNHTIVHARDKRESATFLARILAVEVRPDWGLFVPIAVDNGTTLDYMDDTTDFTRQHYAFLVDDSQFDGAWARLIDGRVPLWGDPRRTRPGEINHLYGGRGLYFDDPDGHLMEIMTRPYGPAPESMPEPVT